MSEEINHFEEKTPWKGGKKHLPPYPNFKKRTLNNFFLCGLKAINNEPRPSIFLTIVSARQFSSLQARVRSEGNSPGGTTVVLQ
jgi:hypothetical protein